MVKSEKQATKSKPVKTAGLNDPLKALKNKEVFICGLSDESVGRNVLFLPKEMSSEGLFLSMSDRYRRSAGVNGVVQEMLLTSIVTTVT